MVRFYQFNTSKNENAYVDPNLHNHILIFKMSEDELPELLLAEDTKANTILDFIKNHLSE